MRIALEKMKLASKKKVIVKVFTEDGASKAVVVDEDMTSAMVCHLLAMKNHADESPQWEMIERIGDLGLERVLEDHENVVDIHTSWPRDNKNVFIFKKNTAKYGLMENPLVSLYEVHKHMLYRSNCAWTYSETCPIVSQVTVIFVGRRSLCMLLYVTVCYCMLLHMLI